MVLVADIVLTVIRIRRISASFARDFKIMCLALYLFWMAMKLCDKKPRIFFNALYLNPNDDGNKRVRFENVLVLGFVSFQIPYWCDISILKDGLESSKEQLFILKCPPTWEYDINQT